MYWMKKLQNVGRGLAQRFGNEALKKGIWDAEYARGRWDCLDDTSGDCVYSLLEKYVNGGNILDLGCGSGNTGNELSENSYRAYVGVDIAQVALQKASRRSKENGRGEKNSYVQSDIINYVPCERFDVILLRDSIYYLPFSKIKPVLTRYSQYLNENGVFIVRLFDCQGKHGKLLKLIESSFAIVEKALFNGATAVLVFGGSVFTESGLNTFISDQPGV